LIRPTVIRSAEDWERTTQQALSAFDEPAGGPRRVITVAPSAAVATPPVPVPGVTPATVPAPAGAVPVASATRH